MVAPQYHPEQGGVETHVREVSRRLLSAGHRVAVATTGLEHGYAARETIQGVDVMRVRAWPKGSDAKWAPALWNLVRSGSWDIVHVQSYQTLVPPLAMLAARRASVPYLVTFHGGGHSSQLRTRARPSQQMALRPLLAGAERLIAVARFEIEEYSRLLRVDRERFAYIPNGADLPPVPRDAPQRDLRLIASIGRLERYKGHQHVIAAMPGVLAAEPATRLWIAGRGPYEGQLRRLASDLGVEHAVEIRAIPNEDRALFARELARVGLVVGASSFETHPIGLLEAANLGCPLLVAPNSGMLELVQLGLARAAPALAPAELADAIVAALRDPQTPQRVALPTWDDCADRLAELYRSIAD
jgi:glycosyltransferase involved in cell wall biosynthesis